MKQARFILADLFFLLCLAVAALAGYGGGALGQIMAVGILAVGLIVSLLGRILRTLQHLQLNLAHSAETSEQGFAAAQNDSTLPSNLAESFETQFDSLIPPDQTAPARRANNASSSLSWSPTKK
ncbi:hypothetical protein Dxin01_00777 [Deinococcus xinjiangensis]|uniref:Uncharacterized protein n=1 Tax=Deinococcus xinjiangensis TaxID=457454 RepID=A0ABP9V746_9DEIO